MTDDQIHEDDLESARRLAESIVEEVEDNLARPFDDDALDAAVLLKEQDPGVFAVLKTGLKERGKVNLNDYAAAIKQHELKLRAERTKRRLEELADDHVPHFWRADQAEVAEKLCEMFAQKTGEPPAYEFGKLYTYEPDTGIWEEQSDEMLSATVQSWAGRALVGDPAEDCKTLRVNSTDTAIKLAKARPSLWGQGAGWLADAPKGVGFSDCFLTATHDQGRWQLEVSSRGPENRARFGFDFPIKTATPSPLFDQFIKQLFEGANDALQRGRLVQEQVAASLLGVAPEFGRALILYGPGGCGKSTLLEVIEAAFPDGAVSAVQPQSWAEGPRIALLARSRVNLVNEISVKDMSDIGAVKGVITGDPVTAEAKYKDPFTFRPDAGHIFTANEDQLPSVPSADPPFWDRWHIVPFENRFRGTSGEDRTIANTIIEEELPGVLAWIIEGAKRLFEQGHYTECASGEFVLERWKGQANSVALFYRDATTTLHEVDSKRTLPLISDLYKAYKLWTREGGYKACSRDTFGKRTNALGLHERSDGSRARCRLTAEFKQHLQEEEYKSGGLF
jgi:P4 family phage/plasmid primase-like protien